MSDQIPEPDQTQAEGSSLSQRANEFPRLNARKAYAQGDDIKEHNYSTMVWTGTENVNVNPETLQWLIDKYAELPTQSYNRVDLGYKSFVMDSDQFDKFKERLVNLRDKEAIVTSTEWYTETGVTVE